jgi:dolichyl-phosphate-mannose--protein O-mannosyl transferase
MTQNFENHAKFVPGFHVGVLGIFATILIWSIYRLIRAFSGESVIALLLAIAFILLAFYSRIFALTVQDRVIRLEMALRMQQLFPAEFRPRIPEFSVNQLVALRFASDAELPMLAKKVLDEKLNDRKAIKKMIRDWQPDFLRA